MHTLQLLDLIAVKIYSNKKIYKFHPLPTCLHIFLPSLHAVTTKLIIYMSTQLACSIGLPSLICMLTTNAYIPSMLPRSNLSFPSLACPSVCLPSITYFACIILTGTSAILDHQLAPSVTYPSQPAYRDYLQCLRILYATKLTCKLICIFGLHYP